MAPAATQAVTMSAKPEVVTAAQLRSRVTTTLQQAAADRWHNADITVSVQPPLGKTALQPCSQLSIRPRGSRLYGAVPVTVRCESPAIWQVYFQTQVDVRLPVLVAALPLTRGQRVGAQHITTEVRSLTDLRQDYLVPGTALRDLVARRAHGHGEVLYLRSFATGDLVKRGERVTITTVRQPVRIGALGEALSSGARGEQIQVRNLQSGREISAWVVAAGEVALQAPHSSPGNLR